MILQLLAGAAVLTGIYEYTKDEPKVQLQKGVTAAGQNVATVVPVVNAAVSALQANPSLFVPPPRPPGYTPPIVPIPSGPLNIAPMVITPSGASTTVVNTLADVQSGLNALGVAQPPLVVDGKDGPLTQFAVRIFQAAHGLPDDGKAGPNTKAALSTALSTMASPNAAIGRSAQVLSATLQSAAANVPIVSNQDIQHALNLLGATPPLAEDGNLGPISIAAIKAFQMSHGMLVDGIAGPMVRTALHLALTTPVQGPTASDPFATDSIPGLSNLMSMHGESYDSYARARNAMRQIEHHNYHDNARPLYWTPEDDTTDPPGFVNESELGMRFSESRQKMMRTDGSGVEFSADTDFGLSLPPGYTPPVTRASLLASAAATAPGQTHPAVVSHPAMVSPSPPSGFIAPPSPTGYIAPPSPSGYVTAPPPPSSYGTPGSVVVNTSPLPPGMVRPSAPTGQYVGGKLVPLGPSGYVAPPPPPGMLPSPPGAFIVPTNYNPNIAPPGFGPNQQRYPYQTQPSYQPGQPYPYRHHHHRREDQAQDLGAGAAPMPPPPSPYAPPPSYVDQSYAVDPSQQAAAVASAPDPSQASAVVSASPDVPGDQTVDPMLDQAIADADNADAQSGAIDASSGASQSILDAGAEFGYSSGRTGDFRHLRGTFGFGTSFGAGKSGGKSASKAAGHGRHHSHHRSQQQSPQSQEGGGGGAPDSGGSDDDSDYGAEFGAAYIPTVAPGQVLTAAQRLGMPSNPQVPASLMPSNYNPNISAPGLASNLYGQPYPYQGPQGPGQSSGGHHRRHHHRQGGQGALSQAMQNQAAMQAQQQYTGGGGDDGGDDDSDYDVSGDFGGPAKSGRHHESDNLARSRTTVRS